MTESSAVASTPKHVLVVGGAGYVGCHVTECLLNAGYRVTVVEQFLHGSSPLLDLRSREHCGVIEADITTDEPLLRMALADTFAVVHLAAVVGGPSAAIDEVITRSVNVEGTRLLVRLAGECGVDRFVLMSTCSVYGASERIVDERSEPHPISLYGLTKLESERIVLSGESETLCPTVLRCPSAFGHSRRQRFDLTVNLFTAQAYVEGKIEVCDPLQRRPFVHVGDLAEAVLAILGAPREKVLGEIFNVGDYSLNLTMGDLARTVRGIVSQERDVEIALVRERQDRRDYVVSFEKISRVLDFWCRRTIEEGVREMIGYFRIGHYEHYLAENYANIASVHRERGRTRRTVSA